MVYVYQDIFEFFKCIFISWRLRGAVCTDNE